jgi:hypothetical protein
VQGSEHDFPRVAPTYRDGAVASGHWPSCYLLPIAANEAIAAKISPEPCCEQASPVFGADVSRERNGGNTAAAFRFTGPDSPDEREAILVRHPDVAHEHVRSDRVQEGQSLVHRSGRSHLRASKFQEDREHRPSIVIVIDQNDADAVEPRGPICFAASESRRR